MEYNSNDIGAKTMICDIVLESRVNIYFFILNKTDLFDISIVPYMSKK